MKIQFKFDGVEGNMSQPEITVPVWSEEDDDGVRKQIGTRQVAGKSGSFKLGAIAGEIELSLQELVQLHTTKKEVMKMLISETKGSKFLKSLGERMLASVDLDIKKKTDRQKMEVKEWSKENGAIWD